MDSSVFVFHMILKFYLLSNNFRIFNGFVINIIADAVLLHGIL